MLYVAAEWAPEILGAQAEWRTWLLRGPAGQMAAEGDVGHHAAAAARAAFTLALGLVPGP